MKGIVLQEPGGELRLDESLDIPKPSKGQVLVRSIAVAINPVDIAMMRYGFLVTSWPIVLGCDGAGVVVEAGEDASKVFKKGDHVCGCTRLGQPGYGPFQEHFLMDAYLTFPRPQNLSDFQAATIGVGSLTACLGLFAGSKIPVSEMDNAGLLRKEWLVVLGGSGSVGQYVVQLARICGFSVLATCSVESAPLVKRLGADEVIDYRADEGEKFELLKKITKGNFARVYDTTAKSTSFALDALVKISSSSKKYFMTTDSLLQQTPPAGVEAYIVNLGVIGRAGPDLQSWPTLNADVASYIPMLSKLFNNGSLVPNDFMLIQGSGLMGVQEGVRLLQSGGNKGQKIVVNVQ